MKELTEYQKILLVGLVKLREGIDERLHATVAERDQVLEALEKLAAQCAGELGVEVGEGERLQFVQLEGPEGPIKIQSVKGDDNGDKPAVDA
jgi:hypothetical protein